MAQSLANILIHIIFSTKSRRGFIGNDIAKDLHAYIAGIARTLDSHVHEIGGVQDHVHVFLSLPRTLSVSQLIEEMKKGSSKWIKTKGDFYRNFSWQAGYGAFSVSQSNYDALRKYIQNQEEHHKTVSFQDEFSLFLERYAIKFDERYVWD